MLRVWAAHCRAQCAYALLLAYYVLHACGPRLFAQRHIQRLCPHCPKLPELRVFLTRAFCGTALYRSFRLCTPRGYKPPYQAEHSRLHRYPYCYFHLLFCPPFATNIKNNLTIVWQKGAYMICAKEWKINSVTLTLFQRMKQSCPL